MSVPVTDPALLAQLNAPTSAPKPVTDPAILAQLNDNAPASNEPKIDKGSGLPFLDQVALSAADTKDEKKAYLSSVYGAGAVHEQDGTLYVDINGKHVAAEGGGIIKHLTAEAVGHGPELVGMTGGAILGGVATGGFGAVAGAAGGAMLGKAAEDALKKARGYSRKTPLTEAEALANAAKGGAEAEMGGGVIAKGIERVASGGIPKAISGTTQAIKEQYRRITQAAPKARIPLQSLTPDLRKFQRMEILAQKISGAPIGRTEANKAAVEKLAKGVLRAGGVPESHLDIAYHDMEQGEFGATGEEAGSAVQKRIQAHADMLETRANGIMQDAQRDVNAQLEHLNALIKAHPAGDLGVDVSKGISTARQAFSVQANKLYQDIDTLVADKPIVSTAPIVSAAASIAKLTKGISSTDAARAILAKLDAAVPEHDADIALVDPTGKPFSSLVPEKGGKMTLAQAQRLRTRLNELAQSDSLTPGVTKHELRQLAASVDEAIQGAGLASGNQQAIALLNKADEWYAANIKQFNYAKFNQLINRYRETGTTPDPNEVADLLLSTGDKAQALQVKQLLSPEVWQRVQSQDIDNLLQAARAPLTGEVDGGRLAAELARRGDAFLEAVHSPKLRQQMMDFAQDLVAIDGKLPPEALNDFGFRLLIEQYSGAKAAFDDFIDKDPVAALRDPKLNPKLVYARVSRAANGGLLKRVAAFLGDKSPEMASLRETALRQILGRSVFEYTEKQETNAAVRIAAALRAYGASDRQILFPDGMDRAINQLASDMSFLFPRIRDPAMAGMSAGSILQQPAIRFGLPRMIGGRGLIAGRWYIQAMASLGRWIIEHPGFQRYIIGERAPGKIAQGAQNVSRNLARLFAASTAQQDDQDLGDQTP